VPRQIGGSVQAGTVVHWFPSQNGLLASQTFPQRPQFSMSL
jgi:hypothetical protein